MSRYGIDLYGASLYGEGETPSGVQATAQIATVTPYSLAGLTGVQATSASGVIRAMRVPGPRTFIIAGIQQAPIPPGIVLLPTSEDLPLVPQSLYGRGLYGRGTYGGSSPVYVAGSSQFYTVGEVYWNGELQTEGVAWKFVSPFTHIIQILVNPSNITTLVTLVYYRWNIGVRAGFKVNSYPVPFAFTGTSIVAEEPPPQGDFFTVSYTATRPGTNPTSLFARYPNLVDDMLASHTLYDGASGFQTYRPLGYRVYDLSDNQVWQWSGSEWSSIGGYADETSFYVKALKQIWQVVGSSVVLLYTAGDGPSAISQVLTYPLFGEGIGKNLLVDGFSANAADDYPSAYEVSLNPGDYDP